MYGDDNGLQETLTAIAAGWVQSSLSSDLNLCHMKKAMAIPNIINNSMTNIAASTTTSTTVMTPVLPPSDIVLALILGTPFACDDVYLCLVEVDGASGKDGSVN